MAKTKTKATQIDVANELTYSGKTLAESKLFTDVMWLALTVLDPNKYYTEAEAKRLVEAELERTVG